MPFVMRRLTIERTAAIVLFLLLFAMAARMDPDSDMWWHLRAGEHILETRRLIFPDPFSFTLAGVEWQNHSAFSGAIMALVWSLAGLPGMMLFTAVLAATGMAFVYASGSGSAYLRAYLLVALAIVAAQNWSPRPQMFSFALAAALLWLLVEYRRGRRKVAWLIPPLLWLWCNLHGAFAVGYLMIGATGTGELTVALKKREWPSLRDWRRLSLVTLASLPLLALNPLGLRVYSVPLETVLMPQLRTYIQEWQPPDFSQPQAIVFACLLLLTILLLFTSRDIRVLADLPLLLLGAAMALFAARNMAFFAIICMPFISRRLAAILRQIGLALPRRALESPARACLNLLIVIVVTLGVLLRLRHLTAPEHIARETARQMPVAAVEHLLAESPDGALFNSYNWGGYVLFHARDYPVFIDGRTDLYRDFVDAYYQIAIGAEGWDDRLREHNVKIVLIESESGLAHAISEAADWNAVYQDETASLFFREQGAES